MKRNKTHYFLFNNTIRGYKRSALNVSPATVLPGGVTVGVVRKWLANIIRLKRKK